MEKSKSNQSNDSILVEKSKEDDDETQPDDQSGLLTRSDNVEDAMLDECENLGTESENEKSIEERLRSASLTGSIHEMTDDVRRISLDRRLSLEQANLEEDLDQGCLSSSALTLYFLFMYFVHKKVSVSNRPARTPCTFAQSLVIFAT